jgi:hypothetical protein
VPPKGTKTTKSRQIPEIYQAWSQTLQNQLHDLMMIFDHQMNPSATPTPNTTRFMTNSRRMLSVLGKAIQIALVIEWNNNDGYDVKPVLSQCHKKS